MSILTAQGIKKSSTYADDLFSLSIEHSKIHTFIHMSLMTECVNTRDIPWTLMLLQKQLPSILQSTCYNDENIPFAVEVQRTEIGHLFEHILLEYLCEEKMRKGCDEATFSGRTRWNWQEDPYGMFHIVINMRITDADIFPTALGRSIMLIKRIMTYNQASVSHPTQQSDFPSLATGPSRLS